MNRDTQRYVPSGGGQRRVPTSGASSVSVNRGYGTRSKAPSSFQTSYGAVGSRGAPGRRRDSGYKLLRNIDNDNSLFRYALCLHKSIDSFLLSPS